MKSFTFIIALLVLGPYVCGQSLWDPIYSHRSLISDNTARGVGDILTIVVNENATVTNDETANYEKESDLNALISNFNVLPNLLEPLPQVTAETTKNFEGDAQYDKSNRFQTTLSVIVIDVLPNENLIVEGTRSIVMDGETKIIKLTGIVRRFDVSRANTVSSNSVANAKISYKGTGPLTRATTRGWFAKVLDVVWPF